MADSIELRGIRAVGTHGLLDEERQRAQPFEVDLDLEMDLGPAGASDDLSDTVDYGAVALSAVSVIEGEHADLLERLAHRIALATVQASGGHRVEAVTVTVRKLRPPVPAQMDSAAVRIRRQRGQLAGER